MDAAPQSTVARLFDEMADDYDVLEPWYEHLYERLHAIMVESLTPVAGSRRPRVLDAGCGAGTQMTRLRDLGYTTYGVDLAARLLARAHDRAPDAPLARGDITRLPFASGAFDAAMCVGSTLSFVADPDATLRELGRVLRPGGRLLLECEHKWSLDLAWTLASAVTRDALGYGVRLGTLARALCAPATAPLSLAYPGYGSLTLFSGRDLRRRLGTAGLTWRRAWGIHAITNVLPSTLLHRPHLPRSIATLYGVLRRVDRALSSATPVRALANSLVVLAVKA